MKEFSEEIIEIAGTEYKLFLNRKGIVAWDKYAREENRKIQQIEIELFNEKNPKITKETNPFENINENAGEENDKIVSNSYRKLYWIMLYENYKFNLDKVNELYDLAVKEYGEEQLIALGNQMIDDANTNRVQEPEKETKSTKKLQALRPSKK